MSTTWINRGHFYVPHVTPVLVDCAFNVQPADSGGLGITGLVGQGVKNVFMHTSQTPGSNNGVTNPNPANGVILIQLADNFSRLYGAFYDIRSPLTGSGVLVTAAGALLTVGQAYVITVVGTTTTAEWRTLGVPAGVTPAVGVAFIAAATGAGAGTGQVQLGAAAGSTLNHLERLGSATSTLSPLPVAGNANTGGWLVYRCLAATNSSTTTLVTTAPATGTIIHLALYMSQSSVTVNGE